MKLLGKTLDELKEVCTTLSLPSYTASQLARWMYVTGAGSIDAMSNLSKQTRQKLQEHFELGLDSPVGSLTSKDLTRKYLFAPEGSSLEVEAVVIPDQDRKTLCVSSQAGCKMGCKFCMTGRQGFHGNLDTAQILSQFLAIEESSQLTNAVFMGMGEPLDNADNVLRAIEILTAPWGFAWSPKRITLSTIGVLPQLKRFLQDSRCNLAVSLHNPFPDQRLEFMPVQKVWDIREVVELLRGYDWSGQRRVSFEYTMFEGWNDTPAHARELARVLRGLECRVNLIRFHGIPDFPYRSSSQKNMEEFRDTLSKFGITCTIRASRGEDIFAACGLLAGQRLSQ